LVFESKKLARNADDLFAILPMRNANDAFASLPNPPRHTWHGLGNPVGYADGHSKWHWMSIELR